MQSIKHFGLARLLLLLLLTQQSIVAVAMAGASGMHAGTAEMSAMADGGAHDCGDSGMDHSDGDQQHDHQQCIESGCVDCVGSVAAAVCSSPATAGSPHSRVNWHWSAHGLVTTEQETLYRPPIQH